MGICIPPYTKVSQFPSTSRSILSPNRKIPRKSTIAPTLSPPFIELLIPSITLIVITEINRRNNKDFAKRLIEGVLSKKDSQMNQAKLNGYLEVLLNNFSCSPIRYGKRVDQQK